MTDEEIMNKVKEGRVQMLAILFERSHVKLYNYFLRLTSDRTLSEDLTQEVFFRVLKYKKTYRAESKFTTWMYQIGRNVHFDHLRKHKKEMPLDEVWADEPASDANPEEQLSADMDAEYLHKALEQLSPARKEVLVLSRFQGMKYADMSRVLGCSIASVKVRVHRAVKDLRKSYFQLKQCG